MRQQLLPSLQVAAGLLGALDDPLAAVAAAPGGVEYEDGDGGAGLTAGGRRSRRTVARCEAECGAAVGEPR